MEPEISSMPAAWFLLVLPVPVEQPEKAFEVMKNDQNEEITTLVKIRVILDRSKASVRAQALKKQKNRCDHAQHS